MRMKRLLKNVHGLGAAIDFYEPVSSREVASHIATLFNQKTNERGVVAMIAPDAVDDSEYLVANQDRSIQYFLVCSNRTDATKCSLVPYSSEKTDSTTRVIGELEKEVI